MIFLFGKAAKDAISYLITQQRNSDINENPSLEFQIILYGSQSSQSLRNLTAEHINKLIKVRLEYIV